MTPLRFAEPDRTRLRRKLLDRGMVLATRLAEVLAGKKDGAAQVMSLGLRGKPGMKPEEILRKALDDVEAMRKQIEAGDDAYGRCWQCGVDLGLAALDEVPWADSCPAHA